MDYGTFMHEEMLVLASELLVLLCSSLESHFFVYGFWNNFWKVFGEMKCFSNLDD